MARLRHSLADPLLAMRSSITDPLGRVLSGGTLSGGGGGGGEGRAAGQEKEKRSDGSASRIRLGARRRSDSRGGHVREGGSASSAEGVGLVCFVVC